MLGPFDTFFSFCRAQGKLGSSVLLGGRPFWLAAVASSSPTDSQLLKP